jgi:hypothetical protein
MALALTFALLIVCLDQGSSLSMKSGITWPVIDAMLLSKFAFLGAQRN